jgi:hypothetical protein
MKPYWQKIHPKLGDDAKGQLIKSLTLYLVGSDGTNPVAAKKVKKADNNALFGDAVRWEFESDFLFEMEFNGKQTPTMFLSIKFNQSAFEGLEGFGDYDFDSAWNIQIEIFNRVYEEGLQEIALRSQLYSGLSGGYQVNRQVEALNKRKDEKRLEDLAIRRHKKNGEVPNFLLRKQSWPREYAYQLKKKNKQ